jgi:hypothetical protein
MASIRRYGPSLVAPEVMPRPELGTGAEQTVAAIGAGFDAVNQFLRPVVVDQMTKQGERELAAASGTLPQFELTRTTPEGTATVAVPPGQADNPIAPDGMRVGPTRERAAAGETGPTRNRAAIMFGTDVDSVIAAASTRNGVPEEYMRIVAQLESGGDPNAQNPTSSAGGLFQFVDSTAAQYGLANRMNAGESADAGARLMSDNMRALANALGRQPSVGEVYLAHQQGLGGAMALLSNPNAPVTEVLSQFYDDPATVVTNNGGNTGMTAGEFAWLWVNKANGMAGQPIQFATSNGLADYELQVTNENTFEPRLPFTVRDAAFNAAADRQMGARFQEAMESGMQAAAARANGDLDALRREMQAVRDTIVSQVPKELPGLGLELDAMFTRGLGAAERGAIELAHRRVIAGQEEAQATTVRTMQSEAERLALTGGTAQEISSHLAQSQNALAAFGPREGFTLNGQIYPPDPSRAGTMTASQMQTQLDTVGVTARTLMIQGEFGRSRAPGQYVDEFRRQVYAGNSPLPAGESLRILSEMDAAVRQQESARRTAADAERRRLSEAATTTINSYLELTEAGVPVTVPPAERARILSALSPYPEEQRKAELEFAVADAAAATFGMRGPELMAYTDQVRADVQAAAERGELDLAGAAVIASLEDRVKKAQDAVTAEMIGLPMIEQLALDGAMADEINWDALREQAAGNPAVLGKIAEVERFYRDIETLDGMSAAERTVALEEARRLMADLAASGQGFGAEAAQTLAVVGRLEEWSKQRQSLASTDAVRFAATAGLTLPALQGADTMGAVGSVIAERVRLVGPLTEAEGVSNPVPITAQEVEAISEVYRSSTRAEQSAFLGSIANLGEEQAAAIFERLGQAEPTLYAAGTIYAGGNQAAAAVILRGSVEAKLQGGSTEELAAARMNTIGPLLAEDGALRPIVNGEGIEALDSAAMAYARGLALGRGGDAITQTDLEAGYDIAMGRQADGSGGIQTVDFGWGSYTITTILPAGWTGQRIADVMSGDTQEGFEALMGGPVLDGQGRALTRDDFKRTVAQLRVSPTDQNILVPVDQNGGVFTVNGEIATMNLGTWE